MDALKKMKIGTSILMVFCVVILLSVVSDFMALHDIRQDYVSTSALDYAGISWKNVLPAWCSTSGEWKGVEISMIIRFFLSVFNILVLIYLMKKIRLVKSV